METFFQFTFWHVLAAILFILGIIGLILDAINYATFLHSHPRLWVALWLLVFFVSIFGMEYENRKEIQTLKKEKGNNKTQTVSFDKYLQDKTIRISDLVIGKTLPIIEGITFQDCVLLGPSIIYFLHGCVWDRCKFEGQQPEQVLIEVKDKQNVIGAIGLKDCIFRRCRFRNIGIIDTTSGLNSLKGDFIKTETTF